MRRGCNGHLGRSHGTAAERVGFQRGPHGVRLQLWVGERFLPETTVLVLDSLGPGNSYTVTQDANTPRGVDAPGERDGGGTHSELTR